MPPIISTILAWTFIIGVTAYIIYLLVQKRFNKEIFAQLKLYQRDLAALEQKRLEELDAVKTKLYTNITHEFRTPLTVILGLAKELQTEPQTDRTKQAAALIERNGQHLLSLVNQMLSLAKLESKQMTLHWVQEEICGYIRYLLQSFESLAASKDIQLHFHARPTRLLMDFDPEAIQPVFSNLVSNALKFTPKGGHVYVDLSVQKSLSKTVEQSFLILKIRDTGIGITAEKLAHIFDRFYQVEHNLAGQFHQVADSQTQETVGTGIGLALVKEMVEAMAGDIQAESEVGKGTEFIIQLPISNKAPLRQAAEILSPAKEVSVLEAKNSASANSDDCPLVLIVEDNADVAQYLGMCLEKNYRIIYAENGAVGIEKAIELVPDLIVSDVMMPLKDGFELTEILKKDGRTNHIPVILLTAKAGDASKVKGLELGAIDYILKPFEKKELLSKIQNQLDIQANQRQQWTERVPFFIEKTDPAQAEFLERVCQHIEENLKEEEFKAKKLAAKMRYSYEQLNRKLKALTGKTAGEFIEDYRLAKAKEMLKNLNWTIQEISIETGFRTQAYFSKRFKLKYGKPPTGFRK